VQHTAKPPPPLAPGFNSSQMLFQMQLVYRYTPVGVAAIKALANLALSDAAKDAIRESWGLPVIVESLRSTSVDAVGLYKLNPVYP
jgi:hypothetical protein